MSVDYTVIQQNPHVEYNLDLLAGTPSVVLLRLEAVTAYKLMFLSQTGIDTVLK